MNFCDANVTVTWSFRNHSYMLICYSRTISYYCQCWKQLCCLICFMELIFLDFWMNRNVFTVTFDQCNTSLQNKSTDFFQKEKSSPQTWRKCLYLPRPAECQCENEGVRRGRTRLKGWWWWKREVKDNYLWLHTHQLLSVSSPAAHNVLTTRKWAPNCLKASGS